MAKQSDWGEGTAGENANRTRGAKNEPIQIHPEGTPEYDQSVNRMAANIHKSYRESVKDPTVASKGERFYSDEAFGAAQAISLGINPDSQHGKLYRRRPIGASGNPDENVARHAPEQLPGIHRAAGVLARLSPQTPWDKNVTQAWEAHQMDPKGAEFQGIRAHAEGKTKDRSVSGLLNNQPSDNIVKAVEIAHGIAPVEKTITHEGPDRIKVGSFYNNITHPSTSEDTTVDFRHHDIAYGKLMDTGDPVRGSMKTGSRYRMIEEATNRATNAINTERSDQGKEPLHPHQVQATTWWGDKIGVDKRMARYPGATRSESSSNLYRIPDGSGKTRSLRREDLGKPIGQE